jgi:allophanate hydrolase
MSWSDRTGSLDMQTLRHHYLTGALTPERVVTAVYERIAAQGNDHVWITLLPRERVLAQAQHSMTQLYQPLAGIPFAVKDNIDVAGYPTTVACADFAYVPEKTATVVERLEQAGAILIGKTNLDQFATGLVGTRSPYGTPRNPFNPAYIPGGSSSGSAVAVAAGLVSFALGTDTAGSGRVPAGFNNLIGLKPTPGLVSTAGVFPACRSLDCVSIFALTVADAALVLAQCQGYDAQDIYSVPIPSEPRQFHPAGFTFAVPRAAQLRFFGNAEYQRLYTAALHALQAIGGQPLEIDFSPFTAVADLLYAGPWVAERLAALGQFFYDRPEALHPVTRAIIAQAEKFSAVEAFQAQYQLRTLARGTASVWSQADMLALPTTGTIYTLHELEAEPIAGNTNLGYYTNFVNLLGLAALALPAGLTRAGLPFGLTLVARGGAESALLTLGARLQQQQGGSLGATGNPLPTSPPLNEPASPHQPNTDRHLQLAVFGLHLAGEPLNHQLTDLGGRFVRTAQTAPTYRMFCLTTGVEKPGVVLVTAGDGAALELEIWSLPIDAVGRFLAQIPPPLGLGTIALADGSTVQGFICEGYATMTARDITAFGGWRGYRRRLNS